MSQDQTKTLLTRMQNNKKLPIILFIIILSAVILTMFYPKSTILSTPAYLQKGDLLFCDYKPDFESFARSLNIQIHHPITTHGPHNDHVAMYIGNDMFIEACPYFYDGEKQAWIGVVTTHIGTFHLWAENITYGVLSNVTKEQREGAVSWALSQIGQPYQENIFPLNDDPTDTDDPASDQWFCSELVWAAYLHQGVELDEPSFTVTPSSILVNEHITLKEDEITGLWYPGMYIQWYVNCFFDYCWMP
jgi:uncharacterized protein YycO